MILMDTQVLLWLQSGSLRLGGMARQRIDEAHQVGELSVSAISFWEVGMLLEKGRISLRRDLHSWRQSLLEAGVIEIPINGVIAARAGLLADIHGDPADRLIVATALAGHRLVTSDGRILAWGGSLDRMDARE